MIRFAKPSRIHAIQMRVYGALLAVAAVSFFAIYLSNSGSYRHGRADLYIVEYAIAFSVLAGGLLAAKVWVELLLDFLLLSLAVGIVASWLVNPLETSQVVLDTFVLSFLMTPIALGVYWLRQGEYLLCGA